jgi:hypothetical protein
VRVITSLGCALRGPCLPVLRLLPDRVASLLEEIQAPPQAGLAPQILELGADAAFRAARGPWRWATLHGLPACLRAARRMLESAGLGARNLALLALARRASRCLW